MICPGDHAYPVVKRRAFSPRCIAAEFLGGWVSDIPVCCIAYYLLATRLYLLLNSCKIFSFCYFDDWDFFKHNDYHRCPICRFRKRMVINRWDGWNDWTFHYYPWENNVGWAARFHAVWTAFLRRLPTSGDRFQLEPEFYPRRPLEEG